MSQLERGTSSQSGVTLVELMVSVAVLGVVLALGAPSLARIITSNRISTQTNEFVAGLNLARSEAVRRSQPVTMRSNAGTLQFGSGWKIFTDLDADGNAASPVTAQDGTVLRDLGGVSTAPSIKRVTRSGSAGSYAYTDATTSLTDRMYLVFNSRGANNAGSAAFFKVCDLNNTTVKGRIVQVSPVGRISLDSSSETC